MDSSQNRAPSRRRRPQIFRRADEFFDAAAANTEMAEKLRLKSLRRTARTRGLELRHSAYGYALIDAGRNRVDGRNDFTLDEVAAHLAAPQEG
ncbi:MAG TPA: hypothetical protein VFA56_12340 [Gaiellaceae bacterium]|nr:hypothetical protein [Gaiellaceae bacterium]